MLVYQKTRFDRYKYLKSFWRLKKLEKCFKKLNFCIACNGTQKHEVFIGFVKARCSRATTCIILTSRRVVVSYKQKYVHEFLVIRLFKPAQEKVWLGELTVLQ